MADTVTVKLRRELYDQLAAAAQARMLGTNWLTNRLLTEALEHLIPPDQITLTHQEQPMATEHPKPTVGRIVHLFHPEADPHADPIAGLITAVHPIEADLIDVTAFWPPVSGSQVIGYAGLPQRHGPHHAGTSKPLVWEWPAR